MVTANNLVSDNFDLCPKTGWFIQPNSLPSHMGSVRAKRLPYGSKVQVVLSFLGTVIVANVMKVNSLLRALRVCSVVIMVMVGDTVAMLLNKLDAALEGQCNHMTLSVLEKDVTEPTKF
jgi:putative effector of murein hydrolase